MINPETGEVLEGTDMSTNNGRLFKKDPAINVISKEEFEERIDKVFHLDKHLTANEVLKNVEEPTFYTQWLEAKKGKVKDKTKGKTPERPDAATSSGMPSAEPTPVSNPFA